MSFADNNESASHCVRLIQPFSTSLEYDQSSRKPLTPQISGDGHVYLVASPNANLNPPAPELDYEGALQYLFTEARQNTAAIDLCRELGLPMEPPVEAGVLSYLLRLQVLGRLEEWPMLFGRDNSFIAYILEKMTNGEFLDKNTNERVVWDLRRKETADWARQRLANLCSASQTRRRTC